MGGIAWITKGREVENYLPLDALSRFLPDGVPPPSEIGQFADLADTLEASKEGLGKRFEKSKVRFAQLVTPGITLESMQGTLDLETKMTEAVERIRAWNSEGE